ncbi:MAG: hypothetical protein A2Y38_19510 [Spirochaetes bacterium GWB1_59_5]|nr:MAG: hypothetical protein A2Y38_19510 [Spirochaetes bacterium GWB1_59_5]
MAAIVTKGASKARNLVTDGPKTLGTLKVAAHRASRHAVNVACRQVVNGADPDDLTSSQVFVTERDVA